MLFAFQMGDPNAKTVIAKDFELINKPNLDDDEILTTKIMSLKKFLALIKSGKIIDPPSIIAVLTYAKKNKLD